MKEVKEGFFIPKGQKVGLENGIVLEALDWLMKEGIKGGRSIGRYNIVYNGPDSPFGERLTFFDNNTVVKVPFSLEDIEYREDEYRNREIGRDENQTDEFGNKEFPFLLIGSSHT